jgi:hypothetical protein
MKQVAAWRQGVWRIGDAGYDQVRIPYCGAGVKVVGLVGLDVVIPIVTLSTTTGVAAHHRGVHAGREYMADSVRVYGQGT